MATLLILAGCSGISATPAPNIDSPPAQITAGSIPHEPGTREQVDLAGVELPDLPELLTDLFRELEWAAVRVRESERGLHGSAILPDGRTLDLHGETDAEHPHKLTVHVRVGHFGAPAIERRFFEAFRRELNDR